MANQSPVSPASVEIAQGRLSRLKLRKTDRLVFFADRNMTDEEKSNTAKAIWEWAGFPVPIPFLDGGDDIGVIREDDDAPEPPVYDPCACERGGR